MWFLMRCYCLLDVNKRKWTWIRVFVVMSFSDTSSRGTYFRKNSIRAHYFVTFLFMFTFNFETFRIYSIYPFFFFSYNPPSLSLFLSVPFHTDQILLSDKMKLDRVLISDRYSIRSGINIQLVGCVRTVQWKFRRCAS